MKIVRVVLALALLATACSKASQKSGPVGKGRAYVAASVANMREKPEADSALIAKLPIATEVNVAESQSGWSRVTAGSQSGWVKTELLGNEKPTMATLIAAHDAASDPKTKRTLAERAVMLDRKSLPAMERLAKALEAANDPELERLKAEIAGLKSVHLAANADGPFELLAKQPPGELLAIYDLEVSPGRIWAATDAGILSWEREKKAWTVVWGKDGTFPQRIRQLAADHPSLWALGENRIYRLDVDGKTWKVLDKSDGLPDGVPTSISVGKDSIWISYAFPQGALVEIARDGKVLRSVPSHHPIRIAVDGDRVWMVEENKQGAVELVVTTAGTSSRRVIAGGYEEVSGLVVDDTSVFIASSSGHLDRYDKTTLERTTLSGELEGSALARDKGRVWIGAVAYVGASYDVSYASDYALGYISDYALKYMEDGGAWTDALVLRGPISAIVSLKNGELWLGTRGGIVLWKKGTREVTIYRPATLGNSQPVPLKMNASKVEMEEDPPRVPIYEEEQ